MQGFVWISLAMVALASAHVVKPRIGGPPNLATDSLHAVLVLVKRTDIQEGYGAIGGGSIVSRNRVLTAAHVVRGATEIQCGFYNARFEANRFRRATAEHSLPLTDFDAKTFLNDMAVLLFAENTFPALNVIAVDIAAPTGTSVLASYGFTSPTGTAPNQFPLLAEHTVATCTAALKATPSHFCAGATAPAVVCPGDGGSGLYKGTGSEARLIGIVSVVIPGCVVPTGETTTLASYTRLSDPSVQRFLRSQNIIPIAAPQAPPPPPDPQTSNKKRQL